MVLGKEVRHTAGNTQTHTQRRGEARACTQRHTYSPTAVIQEGWRSSERPSLHWHISGSKKITYFQSQLGIFFAPLGGNNIVITENLTRQQITLEKNGGNVTLDSIKISAALEKPFHKISCRVCQHFLSFEGRYQC